ncbi:MAG: hypothetical protein EZS28_010948, partial [Streblomastix strix]
ANQIGYTVLGNVGQITPIKGYTNIAIAGAYYTDYKPLKRATNDVNGDGKINIVEDWHVNSNIDGMKSMSWVQDVVQKQTEAIGDGVQPNDPMKNNTFCPLKAAYFAKDGPICMFNFQAKVSSQHVNNVFKVFQTVDSDLWPRLPKFFPIKTSFISFASIIQINGNDTPDIVVNQGFGYNPMDLCDFSGSYLIDPAEQQNNNIINISQRISHIDSVIMQYEILPPMSIPLLVFPQYTVTEVSRFQLLALAFASYDLDASKVYIINDTVNKLVIFNMQLRQNGFIETKQYVLSMSQSIDPKRTLLFLVMILNDFNTDPIQDIVSVYLTVGDTDNPARWHIHISSELKADKQLRCLLSTLKSKSVDASRNDGEHHYSIKEIKPESQMPALFDKEILISLRNTDHDLTQIQKSFLSIVLTANVQFDNKFERFEEPYKDGTVLFIKLKSASQVIREYTTFHGVRTVD